MPFSRREVRALPALFWSALPAALVAWAVGQKMAGAAPWLGWSAAMLYGLTSWITLAAVAHLDLRHPALRTLCWWSCVAAGLAYWLFAQPTHTYPGSATLQKSNGEVSTGQPITVFDRGDPVAAFALHPAFEGGNPDSRLTTRIPRDTVNSVLLVAGPDPVSSATDAEEPQGDGVSVLVTSHDPKGSVLREDRFDISPQQLKRKAWLEFPLVEPGRIDLVRIEVLSGPVGSTSVHDTTLVSVRSTPKNALALVRAEAVLLGMTLFVVLVSLSAAGARLLHAIGKKPSLRPVTIGWLLLLGLLWGGSLWVHAHTEYIYFWDYRNYWEKTELVYLWMKNGDWRALWSAVASSMGDSYTLVPAIPLALLSLIRGSVERTEFVQHIVLAFAFPAVLASASLGRHICQQKLPASHEWGWSAPIIGVTALLAFPPFLGTVLMLMPDIGGVAAMVIAVFAAAGILDKFAAASPQRHEDRHVLSGLVSDSLVLGCTLAFMFVFRRWYVFFAAGVLLALTIRIPLRAYLARQAWPTFAGRSVLVACTAATAALSLLVWPLSLWALNPAEHDYANLYSSYDFPLSHTANKLLHSYGAATLAVALAGLVALAWSNRRSEAFNTLLISSVSAAALFLMIQTPGRHHFYLLMPLLWVGLAGALWALWAKGHALSALALMSVLVGGGIAMPQPGGMPLFAGHREWKPIRMSNESALKEMGQWLKTPENREARYCVIASSMDFNQELFRNLWQIDPSVDRNDLGNRLIGLRQVDSMHGEPSRSVLDCDIALAAVPFQFHLTEREQLSLKSILDDLETAQGVGRSFELDRNVEWRLGSGAVVKAYRRVRPTSDAEFQELLDRYHSQKGLSIAPARTPPQPAEAH